MADEERKRKTRSPLESVNQRRKFDDNMSGQGLPGIINEIQEELDKRGRDDRERERDLDRPLVEDTLRSMAASMSRLEELYATLDNKVQGISYRVQNSHDEMDLKLNAIVNEQKMISDRLDRQKREVENRLGDCQDRLEGYGNRIFSLEERLGSFDHGELREAIFDLADKFQSCDIRVDEIMERGNVAESESLKQLIGEMSKKIQYLETKSMVHDRRLLEVSCDLKERYMTIAGVREQLGENLVEVVLAELRNTISRTPNCNMEIYCADLDMVYRAGRLNRDTRFPRSITVVFIRKSLKQALLSMKKQLGWDRRSGITYSEDIPNDVRIHRKILKAIASRAAHSNYNVKMAGNRIVINDIAYSYDELDIIPKALREAIPQQKIVKDGLAFRGKNSFLSNFYPAEIEIEGHIYDNVEQFYQSRKCEICGDGDRAYKILATDEPSRAKSLGDACEEKKEWVDIRIKTLFESFCSNLSEIRTE